MENANQLAKIEQLLESAELSIKSVRQILGGESIGVHSTSNDLMEQARKSGSMAAEADARVITGVFDGQHMIGPDGKQYSIPANYASKSKLIEGDMLKLTILADGSFVYKQIGPAERIRVVGTLTYNDETEEWMVLAGGKSYHVLLASITYFKGEAGDEVVLLIPKDKETAWGAVENIIKAGQPMPPIPTDQPVQEVDQPQETKAADLDEI